MTSPTLTPQTSEIAPELAQTADSSTPVAGSFLVAIDRIQLQPGSCLTLDNLTWPEFEAVLEALGEKRSSRLAYYNGLLELMVPLPEHELSKVVIADFVKAILRLQNRNWISYGSTTFRRKPQTVGIEPDDCFYIDRYEAVLGKTQLDLETDPPPDLAIESDLTSKTQLEAYTQLQVPELWIFDQKVLKIYQFQENQYIETSDSRIFPNIAVQRLIPSLLERSRAVGSGLALRELEAEILALVSPQE